MENILTVMLLIIGFVMFFSGALMTIYEINNKRVSAVCALTEKNMANVMKVAQKKKLTKNDVRPINDLITIINNMINYEINYIIGMEFMPKGQNMMPDYKDNILQVVDQVCMSIGPGLWDELLYYYDRDYIIRDITRKTNLGFIQFLKEYGYGSGRNKKK